MHQDTKRPAATPRQPFEGLTKRQRRIYAYIKSNGPRGPGAISMCVALYELFDGCADAEADMEEMIEAGWLRTVGTTQGPAETGYDVPEADREGYVRPHVREVQARQEPLEEGWEDRMPSGYRMGRG